MSSRPLSRIERAVLTVLNQERSRGSTTLKGATALSVAKLLESQSIDEWVTPAERIILFRDKVKGVVHAQLRGPFDMAEHNGFHAYPELKLLGRLTSWIALHDGPNAEWVPSIKATIEQWGMNYDLRRKKRRQSQSAERVPRDIKEWLEEKGFTCLEDVT